MQRTFLPAREKRLLPPPALLLRKCAPRQTDLGGWARDVHGAALPVRWHTVRRTCDIMEVRWQSLFVTELCAQKGNKPQLQNHPKTGGPSTFHRGMSSPVRASGRERAQHTISTDKATYR